MIFTLKSQDIVTISNVQHFEVRLFFIRRQYTFNEM